jgi:hypothetical protein
VTISFGGTTLFNEVNPAFPVDPCCNISGPDPSAYTELTFNVLASSAASTFDFGAENLAAGTYFLDDVSIIDLGLPPTLTIAESGTGKGQVTSSPAGINCSAGSNQCAAQFAVGTQVTLTPAASAGSSFVGWSGGGCSGTAPCTLTLSANTMVTGSFVPGTTTSPLVASVVPSSQSVEVGTAATATATIINGGSTTASQCAIAPIGKLPATFSYKALPGGKANTPVDIPAGGTANFSLSLTPTAAIAPGGQCPVQLCLR